MSAPPATPNPNRAASVQATPATPGNSAAALERLHQEVSQTISRRQREINNQLPEPSQDTKNTVANVRFHDPVARYN